MSEPADPRTDRLVRTMAQREAAAHLAVAIKPTPPLRVRAVTCPVCGADRTVLKAARSALPPGATVLPSEEAGDDGSTLVMLGCEALTARSLLCVGLVTVRHPGTPMPEFITRSAAWVLSGSFVLAGSFVLGAEAVHRQIAVVEERERWFDTWCSGTGHGVRPGAVVPASTRLNDAAIGGDLDPGSAAARAAAPAAFLFPHRIGREVDRLNDAYLAYRLQAVSRGLLDVS